MHSRGVVVVVVPHRFAAFVLLHRVVVDLLVFIGLARRMKQSCQNTDANTSVSVRDGCTHDVLLFFCVATLPSSSSASLDMPLLPPRPPLRDPPCIASSLFFSSSSDSLEELLEELELLLLLVSCDNVTVVSERRYEYEQFS